MRMQMKAVEFYSAYLRSVSHKLTKQACARLAVDLYQDLYIDYPVQNYFLQTETKTSFSDCKTTFFMKYQDQVVCNISCKVLNGIGYKLILQC